MSKQKKIVELIGRIGPEAAIALGSRKTQMDDRRVDARTRTRAERERRALED
jgi:hypothetical protein